MRRHGASAFGIPLIEQDPEEAVVRGKMLWRAIDDRAQMLGRFFSEPVLREHLGLGEVLGDEIEIVVALPFERRQLGVQRDRLRLR